MIRPCGHAVYKAPAAALEVELGGGKGDKKLWHVDCA